MSTGISSGVHIKRGIIEAPSLVLTTTYELRYISTSTSVDMTRLESLNLSNIPLLSVRLHNSKLLMIQSLNPVFSLLLSDPVLHLVIFESSKILLDQLLSDRRHLRFSSLSSPLSPLPSPFSLLPTPFSITSQSLAF